MRKFIFLFVGLVLIFGLSSSAYAQYGRDQKADEAHYVDVDSTAIDAALVARPCFLHAVTVLAKGGGNAYAEIYDLAAAPTGASGEKVKAEVGEATQYESTRYEFNPPIKMDNGIYVDLTTGVVAVEYRD